MREKLEESISLLSPRSVNGEPPETLSAGVEEARVDPFSIFLLAIRSPVTREKYLQRMGYFFDFLGIPKSDELGDRMSVEKRFNIFAKRAITDVNWLRNSIVRYLQGHKQRVERKEITGSTLRNYIKPIKLFLRATGYRSCLEKDYPRHAERKKIC